MNLNSLEHYSHTVADESVTNEMLTMWGSELLDIKENSVVDRQRKVAAKVLEWVLFEMIMRLQESQGGLEQ